MQITSTVTIPINSAPSNALSRFLWLQCIYLDSRQAPLYYTSQG